MAYSKFNLNKFIKTFNLHQSQESLFNHIQPLEANPWLKETLAKGMQLVISSEKARSELIVMPILLASRELNQNCFSIYSGENLDVNPEQGLTGECDFILTYTPVLPTLQSPIIVIVEAKKHDIENSLGQCAAQMLGARLFNNNAIETIFGCVTSGEIWQFLKLEAEWIHIDKNHYYINELENILGILQAIINFYRVLLDKPGKPNEMVPS